MSAAQVICCGGESGKSALIATAARHRRKRKRKRSHAKQQTARETILLNDELAQIVNCNCGGGGPNECAMIAAPMRAVRLLLVAIIIVALASVRRPHTGKLMDGQCDKRFRLRQRFRPRRSSLYH